MKRIWLSWWINVWRWILNGKSNGKGKEYYLNGKLKFEGKYLNGKKWNGTSYKNNGEIDFFIRNGEKC